MGKDRPYAKHAIHVKHAYKHTLPQARTLQLHPEEQETQIQGQEEGPLANYASEDK